MEDMNVFGLITWTKPPFISEWDKWDLGPQLNNLPKNEIFQ